MSAISQRKKELRDLIRARLAGIDVERRALLSAQAQVALVHQAPWREARAVLGYLPLRDELDFSGALENALAAGKTVALPRFVPELGQYCAAIVSSGLDQLPRGAFGIREPGASAPVLPVNQLDFVLVPGVGFDPGGRRLGRGKGFYDRLLAEATGVQCVKCGVALDEQIVESIPAEPHDVVMNFILTPTRWLAVPTTSS